MAGYRSCAACLPAVTTGNGLRQTCPLCPISVTQKNTPWGEHGVVRLAALVLLAAAMVSDTGFARTSLI